MININLQYNPRKINTHDTNNFTLNKFKLNKPKINTSQINTSNKKKFTLNTSQINTENRIYHIHNIYGLGDSVFNMIFFNNIKKYIEENNIIIIYYAKSDYLHQLQEFKCSNNIFLNSIDKKPNFSLELWIENTYFNYTFSYEESKSKLINYNIFYSNFFNTVIKKLNFNLTLDKFLYYDDDLLNRYDNLPDKYKNFDIMILNSTPFSGQYQYKKDIWDNYIIQLNNHFKILTTTKVDGVLCTFDDNLTIKDIASLSTKAKVIIAINSGVVPGLLNYYTLTTIKHFYIFDNKCYYSYPNFENKKNITDITIEELTKYIS